MANLEEQLTSPVLRRAEIQRLSQERERAALFQLQMLPASELCALISSLGQKMKYEDYANDGGHPRRAVRWNGFMWIDVPEPKKVAA